VQYYFKERAMVQGVMAKVGGVEPPPSSPNKTVESVMSTKVGGLVLSMVACGAVVLASSAGRR
jgi:hypothetical protein